MAKKKQDERFEPQFSILDAPPEEQQFNPLDPPPADGEIQNGYTDYKRPSAPNVMMPGGQASGFGGSFSIDRPTYDNRYRDQIEALSSKIMGRGPFSYNPEEDPLYQGYKEQFTRSGKQAMDDTLGKIAARTGGLASSYAGTAAQQAYGEHMQRLNDKIPVLQQIAYDMYRNDIAEDRRDLDMLLDMERDGYNRYQADMGQFNRDRDFAYGAGRDSIADQRYKDETEYSHGRDQIMDDRYADELERKQLEDKANMMASAGDFSGFAALGYTPQQIQILKSAYDKAQAEKAAAAAAKSRGSGGRGRGSSGGGKKDDFDVDAVDWSDVQDYVDGGGKADDYIGAHYKDLGFGSVSQAKAAWKVYQQGLKNEEKKDYSSFSISYFRHLLQMDPQQAQDYANSHTEGMSDDDYKEAETLLRRYG